MQSLLSTAESVNLAHRHRRIIGTMSGHKSMISNFPWDDSYHVSDLEHVLTPALVLYPEIIESNVARTLDLLGGNPDRWRAHIKTAKLAYTLRTLLDRGVRNFKCATTLELLTACENGATDVLVAYPVMGANAQRVREIADSFRQVRISVLAENQQQIRQWVGSPVGIFLDINPGMNRTGIEQGNNSEVLELIRAIRRNKLEFRGLHYYDGQFGHEDEPPRTIAAHAGYDRLMQLVSEAAQNALQIPELITAGTPTFPCSLSYEAFRGAPFVHRVSPGTIVYCDATSMAQLPAEYRYAPAAVVVTRVVSHPSSGIVTCDAGHKSVSADAGVPTCVVMGHPELSPLGPSEEHLPMQVRSGAPPAFGEVLYLIPRHVCPTVNNFDAGLLVRNGEIQSVEKVSARGREMPLLQQEIANRG